MPDRQVRVSKSAYTEPTFGTEGNASCRWGTSNVSSQYPNEYRMASSRAHVTLCERQLRQLLACKHITLSCDIGGSLEDVEKGFSAVSVESCADHGAISGESCGDDILVVIGSCALHFYPHLSH